jgi:cobalt/nickel transport system permease protein
VTRGHAAGDGLDGLYVAGASPVHRLAPEVKIAATVAYVFAVVATPREALWAFAADAVLLAGVVGLAALSPLLVARRLRIEIPFLLFAAFMPFTGAGPRIDVLGVSLSEPGLWAAWNIVAKGTLGVAASIVLAATTPVADLLRGLDRLHVPRVITAIAGFMVRYLGIVAGEAILRRLGGQHQRFPGPPRHERGDTVWVDARQASGHSAPAITPLTL